MKSRTMGSKLFDCCNYAVLSILVLIAGLPFVYIVAGSLVSDEELAKHTIVLFPTHIVWGAYEYIFSSDTIPYSLGVSVFVTTVGTLFNSAMTCLMAYPLARRTIRGRRFLMLLIVFTMVFNGGIIPTYLVVKQLHLLDTYFSLWLPGAISAFNLILLKNFFQELPEGIEESAKMDGYNDLQILWRIVLPLSKPALATFGLFYAVGYWNAYFSAVIYLNDTHMWPVQVWLRQIVILAEGGFSDSSASDIAIQIPRETVKLAVIVVATLPVLAVYPFLQKYFTKGLLLGSVKG